MALVKLSTAYTRSFKMVSSTDHLSAKTSASPTVNLSKAGGSFAAAGGTVTEVANGWYKIALTTTDTNTLGDLSFYITGSGADDTDFCDQVVSFDTQDATRMGLSALPNAAAAASGGLPTVDGSNAVKVQSGTAANQISLSSGAVTVGTNSDKTGYSLSSSGLDSVSTTAPSGSASNFREMIVQTWRRFFKKTTLTATTLTTFANDGTTTVTTQTVSDDGTTQTQGTS